MCQALTCGQVLAWAWVQVLQSSGSLMIMLRFTTLSAWDRHWLSSRKKKLQRAHCDSNIKSACVSALMGSVPRKMAEVLQRVSALIRNRNHVAWLFRLTSNTKPLVHIKLLSIIWKKLCMSPSILPYQDQTQIQEFLNTLLWLGSGPRYQILSHVFARCLSQTTHCHERITRFTAMRALHSFHTCFTCYSRMAVCCLTSSTCKNVWHKSYTSGHCLPLIDTSHCIWHRLELKYFHFAQFLLNAHQAAHWPRKVRTKNLKFRTDLPDQVIYGWSVTSRWLFAKKNCSENLQIENQSSICQRWSLHGFKHHISFATYLAASFGCNQFRIPKP